MKRNDLLYHPCHSFSIYLNVKMFSHDAVSVPQAHWRLFHLTHVIKLMRIVLANIIMAGKK